MIWKHGDGYRQLAQAIIPLGEKISVENQVEGIYIKGQKIVIPFEVADRYLHLSERTDGMRIWVDLVGMVESGKIVQMNEQIIVITGSKEKVDFITIKIRRSTKDLADEWMYKLGVKTQAEFFDRAVKELINLLGGD